MSDSELNTDEVYFKLSDDILYLTYKKGVKMTLEKAKLMVENRLDFTKQLSYPLLVDDKGLASMDKEARDFLSSKEGVRGVKAGAILTSSAFNTMLANFFLKINFVKLIIPAKLFTNKDSAVQWLNGYR